MQQWCIVIPTKMVNKIEYASDLKKAKDGIDKNHSLWQHFNNTVWYDEFSFSLASAILMSDWLLTT